MSGQPEIKIVYKGALTTSGFAEYIASTESFARDLQNFDSINDLDKKICSFYDHYLDSYNLATQYYCFNFLFNGVESIVIVRCKKNFTKNSDGSRHYDRREYYIVATTNGISKSSLMCSLPPMRQFSSTLNGRLENLPIKVCGQAKTIDLLPILLEKSLGKERLAFSVVMDNAEEIKDQLLYAIDNLPFVYQKYIGFAFNISASDLIAIQNIHLFTTLDESSLNFFHLNNSLCDELIHHFADFVLNNPIALHEDEIINSHSSDQLYDIINYHFLHFRIENVAIAKVDQPLINSTREYIANFFHYSWRNNQYLCERTYTAFIFLLSRSLLSDEEAISFLRQSTTIPLLRSLLMSSEMVKSFKSKLINNVAEKSKTFAALNFYYLTLDKIESINGNSSLLEDAKLLYIRKSKSLQFRDFREITEFFLSPHLLSKKISDAEVFRKLQIENIWFSLNAEDYQFIFKHYYQEIIASDALDNIFEKLGGQKVYDLLVNANVEGSNFKKIRTHILIFASTEQITDPTSLETVLKWKTLIDKNKIESETTGRHYLDFLLENRYQLKLRQQFGEYLSIIDKYNHIFSIVEISSFLTTSANSLWSESNFNRETLLSMATKLGVKVAIDPTAIQDANEFKKQIDELFYWDSKNALESEVLEKFLIANFNEGEKLHDIDSVNNYLKKLRFAGSIKREFFKSRPSHLPIISFISQGTEIEQENVLKLILQQHKDEVNFDFLDNNSGFYTDLIVSIEKFALRKQFITALKLYDGSINKRQYFFYFSIKHFLAAIINNEKRRSLGTKPGFISKIRKAKIRGKKIKLSYLLALICFVILLILIYKYNNEISVLRQQVEGLRQRIDSLEKRIK